MGSLYTKNVFYFGFIIFFIQFQVCSFASSNGGASVRIKKADGANYEITLSLNVPRTTTDFGASTSLHLSSAVCGISKDITLNQNDSADLVRYTGTTSFTETCADLKIDYSFLRETDPVFYSFSCKLSDLILAAGNGLVVSATSASASYDEVLLEAKNNGIPESDLSGYVQYRMQMNSEVRSGTWNKRIASTPNIAGASCTNVDFEDGTLNGWSGTTGMNPGCCPTPGFVVNRQTVTSGAGLDACGGFPVVCPGGSYSVKLGANISGGLAEQLIQTFTVSASSTNFTYKYAVVLEDPGHSLAQQPFFKVEMLDQNGNPIPCSLYFVAAGQNIPGFLVSSTCPGVVYKPWSTVSVDLSGYVGQSVTIRFTAADCTLGGHFGYAYIDGTCLPLALTSSGDVCAGNTVTLTAPAGSLGYSWSPGGQTTSSITVNASGTYSCTLTSVQGCDITLSIPVNFYPLPVAQFSTSSLPCSSSFGFTDASTCAGGTINGWLWNFGDAGATGNTPNQSHTYPAPGNYTVSLQVSTTQGCTNTTSQIVTALVPPSLSLNETDVSCFGGNNGTATATVSGGKTPYTYSWSNTSTTQTATALVAGTYTFTVTDAAGCQVTNSVVVNQPANPLAISTAGIPPACFGGVNGSSSAIVTGGTPSYSYSWNTSPAQTTSTAQNLPAGTYNLTVTDNKGCIASAPLTITQPALLSANVSLVQNVSCYGGHDGSLAASAVGGTAPYNYVWNTSPVQNTNVAGSMTAGSYQVTVTDSKGCTVNANGSLTQPTQLNTLLVSASNPSCSGNQDGQINMAAGGGTPPYQYSWNTVPVQSSPLATNLGAGTYMLTVTDSKGCVVSTPETLTQPALLVAQVNSGNVKCNGGQTGWITSAVSGGTASYTYSWSTGSAQPGISGIPAGNYTLDVTDAKGCKASALALISAPSALSLTTTNTNPVCFGGSNGASVSSVTGGTPGYTYSWSTSPVQTTASAQNLSAGPYTLTVTDNNGCMISIPVGISQPSPINSNVVAEQNISCKGGHDGSVSVTAGGGTAPYSYTWNTTPVQTGANATGLGAGHYQATVTDSKGCVVLLNANLTEPQVLVSVIVPLVSPACFGSMNGQLSGSASGGTAPYQYSWNTVPVQSGSLAMNLGAGTYVLNVKDAKGCLSNSSATLNQPALLAAQTSSGNLTCYASQNGWITSTVSGGTAPFSYAWNVGASVSSAIANLAAGTYVLQVSDAHGCLASATTTISQPSQLQASINVSDETCNGGMNGWLSSTTNGGTSPYSYSWNSSSGTNGPTLIGLKAGPYMLTVTDHMGCHVSVPATIHEPTAIIVNSYGSTKICAGQSASLYALASGGNGSYTYLWNQGIGVGASQIVTPKVSTDYVVSVSDNAGCQGPSDTVHIQVIVLDSSNLVMSPDRNLCPGQSESIYAGVNGSTGSVTYSWSNNLGTGAGPFLVGPSATTTYTVQVVNTCGAAVTGTVTVQIHPFPVISLTPQNVAGCGDVSLAFMNNAQNPGASYQWNFGDGSTSTSSTPVHIYSVTGNYTITLLLTSSAGCVKAGAMTDSLTVFTPTVASFYSPDEVSELAPRVPFTNTSKNAVKNSWDFGDHTSSAEVNPVHVYQSVGTYTVSLMTVSPKGCVDSVSKVIEVIPEFSFYVPNAFTPDADGKNDVFNGKGEEIADFSMMIFDRWGELIYTTTDKDKGWDGRANNGSEIAQTGVYVYKIRLHDFKGNRHDYLGSVTLLK